VIGGDALFFESAHYHTRPQQLKVRRHLWRFVLESLDRCLWSDNAARGNMFEQSSS
jgi:hypothetical protein